MDVEAAQPRRRQHGPGQDQAVGGDHTGIQGEGCEGVLLGGILQAFRGADGDAVGFGEGLDGDGVVRCPRPAGLGGRGVGGPDPVTGHEKDGQDRHREIGASHEGEVEAGHGATLEPFSTRLNQFRFSPGVAIRRADARRAMWGIGQARLEGGRPQAETRRDGRFCANPGAPGAGPYAPIRPSPLRLILS